MVQITYIQPDGLPVHVAASVGMSVMEGAVKNSVAGIEAACGGACSCATCHVKIPDEWRERVGPPSEIEADMLDGAIDANERSRLSCQIAITDDLDGLIVEVAG